MLIYNDIGAVQGYGVLIAVDEDADTGCLVVRQVSENATELLGLSPKYLFSLKCFTESLSNDQADVLLDNLQFLSEPDHADANVEDHAVHVFTLSGQGQVDYDPNAPDFDHTLKRRIWTVWAAVHRPTRTNGEASGLIIMEFELERDSLNPLHPIFGGDTGPSGITTPSVGPSENPRSLSPNSSAGTKTDTAGSRQNDSTTTITPSVQSQGTEKLFTATEEGEWMPNAASILESTTSLAKPIPALERLRRISSGAIPDLGGRGAKGRDARGYGSTGIGSKARTTSGRVAGQVSNSRNGNFSMMDVFAVCCLPVLLTKLDSLYTGHGAN